MILASAANVRLDSLAEMADKIAEYIVSVITSVTPASSASRPTVVEEHLQILTNVVNALQLSRRGRQRSFR